MTLVKGLRSRPKNRYQIEQGGCLKGKMGRMQMTHVHSPTLVSEFKALSVFRVVAVEVDDGLVRAAQQRGRELAAAELTNQRAAVVRPVANL